MAPKRKVYQGEEISKNDEELNFEVRRSILVSGSLSVELYQNHFFDEFIPET